MMDLDLARRLVQRHLVRTDEKVLSAKQQGEFVIVETADWTWQLRPGEVVRAPVGQRSFMIVEAELDLMADPATRSDGVVIDDQGDSLHLNDPAQFQRFWRTFGDLLEPVSLAALIERYQGSGPPAHLVVAPEKLSKVTGGSLPKQVSEVTGVVVTERTARWLSIIFYSWYVNQAPRNGTESLTVIRWDVYGEFGKELRWTARALSPDIPWSPGRA